jgi:Response regulators consisting of a CheY-like receiver domain and a winged-helix DNA-binding domain
VEETRILIVDDNLEIREIIHVLLGGEGFEIEEAGDGTEALDAIRKNSFDLIILDIMMPGLNGYQTCLEIRKLSNAPILFLSARTKESDKTLGFSSGGDDYLEKPFSYNELISRSKALIRRYQVYKGKDTREENPVPGKSEPVKYHYLEIDEAKEQVRRDGKTLELTDTEYAVLLLLVKNRRQIFSAERLYEAVWDEPYYYGANNTVTVHIRNLRLKIEKDPKNPLLIKTVWGKGYRCD